MVEGRIALPAAVSYARRNVAIFNVRLPDDLADRFDEAAASHGGRSVVLRRLIHEAAGASQAGVQLLERGRPAKLTVRLADPDLAALAAAAAELGLTPNAWAAALIRRRLSNRPAFSREGERGLMAIQTELRRIGVNLNQMARALNTEVMEGRVLDLQLTEVRAFRDELRGRLSDLRAALAGNLDYWEAAW